MPDELNADANDDLIDQIAEEYLSLLRQHKVPDIEAILKAHLELAPALEKRLRLVDSIFHAAASAKNERAVLASDALAEPLDRNETTVRGQSIDHAVRISCPHCGNKVQLVGLHPNEVTCASCGSSVKVVTEPTVSLSEGKIPKRLGRFIIKRVLGEGAFGIVFLATDPKLDREVAIKTPRTGFFPTREEERRFFREAKHAAGLRHPNIVQVHEIAETTDAPLIVSEYIDGLTLNDVATSEQLTFKETARLMIQIASAVEFAHQKGIIHRDLKPSNILLDEDRNAYITDFGLARRDDVEITMTLDGAILGTPAYMAPEQAQGNQSLTGRRSDVYSLGVILYRLIAKDLPFHGTRRMLVYQVIHDDPKPPRRLNEFIPRDLETITLKAMAKSPDARYQSARELAEELQRFLMGEPIRARPMGMFGRFARWCGRHQAVASLSGAIAGLLVSCAVISGLWAWHAERLRSESDRHAQAAISSDHESSHRLHELLMSNGSKELEQDNLPHASLWFTEALAVQDEDHNRTRIAMIQDRLPTLTSLWATGSRLYRTGFSADGSRIAAASEQRIQIFDAKIRKALFDELVPTYTQFRLAADGAKFAICAGNNSAQLWNVDERRLIAKLQHAGSVESAEFNPASTKLVTASMDGTAKVWNAKEGSLIAERKFEGLRVIRALFVKDTDLVIVVLKRDGEFACQLAVWNHVADSLSVEGLQHGSHVVSVVVSADGKNICSAERDGAIKIWEIATGKPVGTPINTGSLLYDALYSGDGTLVVGLFANGEVASFDSQSGARRRSLNPSGKKITSIAQSSDQAIVALAGVNGQAQFYWNASGLPVCSHINNGLSISSIAFHPDGHQVAVAGSNGVLQLWDLAGSCPSSIPLQHTENVRTAMFAPKSNRCLTTSMDGTGYIWNVATGQRVGDALTHEGGIIECDVTAQGNLFATAGEDNFVKIWDSLTGKQLGTSYSHSAAVNVVQFSHDGSRISSGDASGKVRTWQLSGSRTGPFSPLFEANQTAAVIWLAVSQDDKLLASASLDGTIRLWDAITGIPNPVSLKHGDTFATCRFLPDGKRLISSGEDPFIYIWNLETGVVMQKLACHAATLSVQVLENGRKILATSIRGTTSLWSSDEQGNYSLTSDFSHAANDTAYYAACDSQNTILGACGGWLGLNIEEPQSGALVLWNLKDERLLAPPLHHQAPIRRVRYNAETKQFLSASEDGTARLWNIKQTSLPVKELQQISRLYSQSMPDTQGGLQVMDADMQVKEFEALSRLHPTLFTLDSDDQRIWDFERVSANHASLSRTTAN